MWGARRTTPTPSDAPSAPADREQRRERAARGAAAERDGPGDELQRRSTSDGAIRHDLAGQDAARCCRSRRRACAARSSRRRRPRWPPSAGHHIQCRGSVLESVFDGIDGARHAHGGDADDRADARRRRPAPRADGGARPGIANTGPTPTSATRTPAAARAGERHRDERSRAVLEEQQLDRQQHGGRPGCRTSPPCPPRRPRRAASCARRR